jgi:hypothetical protein
MILYVRAGSLFSADCGGIFLPLHKFYGVVMNDVITAISDTPAISFSYFISGKSVCDTPISVAWISTLAFDFLGHYCIKGVGGVHRAIVAMGKGAWEWRWCK